ncbi:MAG: hypothetical protein LBJ41_00805 [Treponema sp.]|jgi:hypothetical protein|nr:hypothetical protein [Treponema sp.]
MEYQIKDTVAYQKVTDAFKKQKQGATVADIVARTALPLETVKELAPAVSDEFSGRLEVTASGEIKYSFPRGFTSRYRGFRAGLRRFTDKLGKGAKVVGKGLFKGWIMVMLVGYFVLFMALAAAALLASVAGSMSGNNRSESKGGGLGGFFLASHVFNLIIRIWFYSELTKSFDPSYSSRQAARKKGKPLYKAIFSFVFGDDDPNADWAAREKQAVISYLQVSKGVISLPEFMNLTGLPPQEADRAITAYCAEFGGSPEATEDGTVVYRFDALLRRADKRDRSFGSSSPLKRLKSFSSNQKKMNVWFSVINGVNLLFGSYFLTNALSTGAVSIVTNVIRGKQVAHLVSQSGDAPSYLYGLTYALSSSVIDNPLPLITIGLGIVPLVFSVFFWLIPLIRSGLTKRDNERIKMENLRKLGYSRIWGFPRNVKRTDIGATVELEASRPQNLGAAQDRVIKELGTYAIPEVSIADDGTTVYNFTELEREKAALEKYRDDIQVTDIGETIFDSEE